MPQGSNGPDLSGLRILVVEDMVLVAEEIGDELRSRGCAVVGPAGSVADALGLVAAGPLDGALLDVNLNGEFCFPIASALRERQVPFVFLTGYSDAALFPPEFAAVQRVAKPFDSADLTEIADLQFRHRDGAGEDAVRSA